MHYTPILLAAIYPHLMKDYRSGPGRRMQGMMMTSPLQIHPSGQTLPGEITTKFFVGSKLLDMSCSF